MILADSVQKPQFRRLPGKCSYCSYCSMVCDEVSYTFPVCSLEKKLANFRNNPSLLIVLYRAYVSVLPESRHTRRRVIKYQHSNFMLHECLISDNCRLRTYLKHHYDIDHVVEYVNCCCFVLWINKLFRFLCL